MAGQRDCDSVVTAGRMSKANEFFDAADHLGEEMPNAAGDLYVDAGIAASDVICCVRLGVHSNTGNHNEAVGCLHTSGSDLCGVEEDEPRGRALDRGGQTNGRIQHLTGAIGCAAVIPSGRARSSARRGSRSSARARRRAALAAALRRGATIRFTQFAVT